MLRILWPLLIIIWANNASAMCDLTINPITKPKELAYSDRGDRCEGLFIQDISGNGLRVIGYHKNRPNFTANSMLLDLTTSALGNKSLTLVSTRPRHYYRMDAAFSTMSYLYPLEIANHPEIELKQEEVSALACISACDSFRPSYAPINFGNNEQIEGGTRYVILQANHDLYSLKIEVVDTNNGKVLFNQDLLLDSVWRAWRPAELPVDKFFEGSNEVKLNVMGKGRNNYQFTSLSFHLQR